MSTLGTSGHSGASGSGLPPTVREIAHLPVNQLPERVLVPRVERPFDVTIRPPGSKSITNRALLLAALAEGTSVLRGALVDADDAQVMIRALEQLGATIRIERSEEDAAIGNATLHVTGVAGRWRPRERNPVLNLSNAGTATRFLAAAAILSDPAMGQVTIDGNARMRERPIGELVDLLRDLRVDVRYSHREGFPPIVIQPPDDLSRLPGLVKVGPVSSSQFISAMLLIGPFLPRGLSIRFEAGIPSEPYVNMTTMLLGRVGARVRSDTVRVTGVDALPESLLKAVDLLIESDLSGACFFWSAAAVIPGASADIEGAAQHSSTQGDAAMLELLEHPMHGFGCKVAWMKVVGPPALRPVEASLVSMPDAALATAVVSLFASPTADNPTATITLSGLKTLRVKETDRLAALQAELTKIGAKVEIETTADDEVMRITPPEGLAELPVGAAGDGAAAALPLVEFETYDDHRMAMALALIGLRRGNVIIKDPACVRKTYPTYWRDLARLYGGREGTEAQRHTGTKGDGGG